MQVWALRWLYFFNEHLFSFTVLGLSYLEPHYYSQHYQLTGEKGKAVNVVSEHFICITSRAPTPISVSSLTFSGIQNKSCSSS